MREERQLTPAHHLEDLLTRSQNPFDVSDAVLDRLRSAVMYRVELHGWRHRNAPARTLRCSSFRHIFLLADGSSLLLWELCYDSEAGDAGELCEVYDNEESLRRSERRVHRWMGGPEDADGTEEADGGEVGEGTEGAGELGGAGCPEETAGWRAPDEDPDDRYEDEDEDGSLASDDDLAGLFGELPPGVGGFGSGGSVPLGPGNGTFGSDGGMLGPDGGVLGPESGVFGPDGGMLGPESGVFGPDGGMLGPESGVFGGGARGFDGFGFGSRAFEDALADSLRSEGLGAEDLDDLDSVAERGAGPARISFDFLIMATGAPGHREYAERGSADHARRLLRRAENEDRPGDETLRLLNRALGHQILHVPGPLSQAGESQVWCSVYEHAFLLPDGSEVSLYELEHNLSGTGRLVCEVYLEESGAGQAAHRLARDRGIDL
ncbi:DUF6227 family protein [Streptomyces iconiensis]|uniref:DUF6227 family protein n=1 Tax=Streptomyces iconiensis TaxID=1384038 RepID=A0ABT6ZPY7_9ACTN|nr:DUF6227 family protein [Streptomyces iconiensis]MDJ1131123.1 DUF6227 family protein [Streptomyces iconiensis]